MSFPIIIDSNEKHATSTSNSDLKVRFKDMPTVRSVTFKSLTIPFSWYPIDSTNNTLVFNEGAGDLTATISTPASWTGSDIASAIKTAMDAAGGTYTVTYNASSQSTYKFTISSASNFTLKFATSNNTLYRILGFNNVDTYTGTNSYTGDNVSAITGPDYVLIRSQALSTGTKSGYTAYCRSQTFGNDKNITSTIPVFMTVPINVGINELITYTSGDIDKRVNYNTTVENGVIVGNKVFNEIDLQLINPWTGNAFNINGGHWMLELEAEI